MRFKNNKGDLGELNAVSWDKVEDWLVVRVKGTEAGHSWEGSASCLRSTEAQALANWMNTLGMVKHISITFLEPELAFQFRGRRVNRYIHYY